MLKITRECYRVHEDQDGYHDKGPGKSTITNNNNQKKPLKPPFFFKFSNDTIWLNLLFFYNT